jgi:uncharacterized membrane protein YkvA (DUF1232 family)
MRDRIERTKSWARRIKRDVLVLWIAARDPRTPLIAKAVAAAVAAYALSPIDLIPDFVPVLGYLDDLLIVPAGIMLAVRLIPADLLAVFRVQATQAAERLGSRVGAAIIVLLWAVGAGALLWAFWPEAGR